jgi:hypothetical protein
MMDGLSDDAKIMVIMCGVTLLALAHPILYWFSHLFNFGSSSGNNSGGGKQKPPPYGDKSFWEKRYADHPDTYEWFATYDDLCKANFLGSRVYL